MMADTFGERIKELRAKMGLTQRELGELLGRGDSTVRMWELNRNQPNHEFLLRLAQIFGVSTDQLLGKSESAQPGLKQYSYAVQAINSRPALAELVELIYDATDEDVAAILRITRSYLQK